MPRLRYPSVQVSTLLLAAQLFGGCEQAPRGGQLARYLLVGPTGEPCGSSALYSRPSGDGVEERMELRSGEALARWRIELRHDGDGLLEYSGWRRVGRQVDEVELRRGDDGLRWRAVRGLAVERRALEPEVRWLLEEPVAFGDRPSGSLAAWGALLARQRLQEGTALDLEVVSARRGLPVPLRVEAREARTVTLDGAPRQALRLFAATPMSGHTLWVDAADGRLLAASGVAGANARLAGLELPPQPRAPLPPEVVERELQIEDASVVLAGTISWPRAADGPRPAVLLVHGSGPLDRDENAPGLRLDVFRQLAHHLSARGFAVLRYDKRGAGQSRALDGAPTTLPALADDAARWVEELPRLPEVDGACLFVAGHSEGGYIAPMVASGREGVQGVVLLAGALHRLDVLLVEQLQLVLGAAGASDDELREAQLQQQATFKILTSGAERDVQLPASHGLGAAWLRSHLEHQPEQVLEQLRQPLLALYGGKDIQVPPSEAEALSAFAAAHGRADFTVEVVDGLDHLLMRFDGAPGLGNYADPDRRVDAEVLARLDRWLAAQPCVVSAAGGR